MAKADEAGLAGRSGAWRYRPQQGRRSLFRTMWAMASLNANFSYTLQTRGADRELEHTREVLLHVAMGSALQRRDGLQATFAGLQLRGPALPSQTGLLLGRRLDRGRRASRGERWRVRHGGDEGVWALRAMWVWWAATAMMIVTAAWARKSCSTVLASPGVGSLGCSVKAIQCHRQRQRYRGYVDLGYAGLGIVAQSGCCLNPDAAVANPVSDCPCVF